MAEKARQRYGERIHTINATVNWYTENMPPFKAAFENQTLTVPKDADIVTDLHMFEEVKGVGRMPDKRTNSKETGKRHGDAGIACVHAHFASRQDAALIELHAGAPDRTDTPDTPADEFVDIGFGAVRRDNGLSGY
ncbi:MAG: hypothetical protein ACSHXY_09910 [Alphaproteobacteria bacterium]